MMRETKTKQILEKLGDPIYDEIVKVDFKM